MKTLDAVDMGSIHVHRKVLLDLVSAAINDLKEVRLMSVSWIGSITHLIGFSKYSGISIKVNKDSQVTVDVNVCVIQGAHIPDIAVKAQDAIRSAIEKTVDIDLKEINVNIRGIERSPSR